MTSAAQVMSIASKYIGYKENPPGSNNVVFNTDYYGRPVNGGGYDWCCTFVWDVFRMAGASDLFYNGEKVAYCPYVAAWGKAQSVPVESARYGDIVLYDFNKNGAADHIGFIEGRTGNGAFSTIEGNTGDGEVKRMTRTKDFILMIVRPKYTQAAPVPPPEKEVKVNVEMTQISNGATGAQVKTAQALLVKKFGYSVGTAGVDGIFGADTTAAVKRFQRAKGLVVDGIIGVKTWAALLH